MEKIRRKILMVTTITSLIIGSIIFGLYNKERQERGCLKYGGIWFEQGEKNYRKCENINPISCENIGGKFNDCASDCRKNQINPLDMWRISICIRECTKVCEFKGNRLFPFFSSDFFQSNYRMWKWYYQQWKWW